MRCIVIIKYDENEFAKIEQYKSRQDMRSNGYDDKTNLIGTAKDFCEIQETTASKIDPMIKIRHMTKVKHKGKFRVYLLGEFKNQINLFLGSE